MMPDTGSEATPVRQGSYLPRRLVRTQRDSCRRLLWCGDAYGGHPPAPTRFPWLNVRSRNRSPPSGYNTPSVTPPRHPINPSPTDSTRKSIIGVDGVRGLPRGRSSPGWTQTSRDPTFHTRDATRPSLRDQLGEERVSPRRPAGVWCRTAARNGVPSRGEAAAQRLTAATWVA